MKPAIVLKAQFITPSSKSRKSYSSYIDYINRKEALNESEKTPKFFSKYIDYMNDRKKGAYGFNDVYDKLENNQTNNIAKIFDEARNDNRILWQDVYSFDNEFLKSQGLYNSKSKELDSKTLISSVRESMKQFKKDGDIDNLVWTGAIHRNTDNIHIHVASVNMDENIQRDSEGIQKGFRSEKTVDNMKSKFINNIIDRNQRLDIMSNQRDQLVETDFLQNMSKKEKEQLEKIKDLLPENKNKWQYNRQEIKHIQPMIDEYTNSYIKKNHPKKYKSYHDILDEESLLNKQLYGEGTKEYDRYKNTKTNKLDELDQRMGNALLKHLKEEDALSKRFKQNEFYKNQQYEKQKMNQQGLQKRRVIHNPVLNRRTQFMIERGFNSRYKDQRLEMDNKRLEQSIEQEKSRQQYENEL
ncbi:MAG TPA: MobP2 family relaxase [Candidatus Dormibacteraeota bacterium]|nr:MobP2 family relaxase [Candidatus Dormibacteraeota bacterium]